MILYSTIALFLTLSVGLSVLVTNPDRATYRAFAVFSGILSLWISCVIGAILSGRGEAEATSLTIDFWLRMNTAISSFAPGAILMMMLSISSTSAEGRGLKSKAVVVFFICLLISLLTVRSDFLIRTHGPFFERGRSYYLHAVLTVSAYATSGFLIFKSIRAQRGLKRIELQYLALAC